MVGATCFALGSFPLYFNTAPAQVVGTTFFVGSIFFTSAGVTQLGQELRDRGDRKALWAAIIQLVGMVFFNINTFRAGFVAVPEDEINRLIWAPDLYGSIAFLAASHLAWLTVCGRVWCVDRTSDDWWIAALNYLGSIFFICATVGAFTLPTTDELVNIAVVNAGTFLGACCFFLGGYLLLPSSIEPPRDG